MNLLSHLANLFISIAQRARPAYTTIIYPTPGKAVVVHDGLGLRHERRWQMFDPLLDGGDPSTSFSAVHDDNTSQTDPVELFQADSFSSDFLTSSFDPMVTNWLNPANGMPMIDSCFDVMGNACGMDTMSNNLSFDNGMSDFGDNFCAFSFD